MTNSKLVIRDPIASPESRMQIVNCKNGNASVKIGNTKCRIQIGNVECGMLNIK